ncbi:MAG: efflux RND transporter permease subunit [Gemmatimonadetes bacterium]|nr:efflux RND transporter permease subunit [Gemmatimonadota bacterium]
MMAAGCASAPPVSRPDLGVPVPPAWTAATFDVTLNMITPFAFILVLGIVVDDAIIVGENVYTHQERHGQGLKGAIDGTQEIAVPVIFAVLTTVAAFSPLLSVPGTMGKIMRAIPLIVIPCLLFSLLESLMILPAHLSHMRSGVHHRRPGPWHFLQSRVAGALRWVIDRAYRPSLEFSLRWRYLTAAVGLSILILTGAMLAAGLVVFEFFPAVESDRMSAAITTPAEGRTVGSDALLERWRAATGAIAEAVELRFEASMFSAGEDVNVQFAGPDVDELRSIAADLKTRLADYAGVYDIADSFREGKREIQLGIRPAAETLGLTLADLGRQVRQAFYGEEAQRIQRDRDDVRVMVRYPRRARHPGVYYTFEGMQSEQRDTIGGLQRGFLLAMFMVFALLAVPLRSYVQPVIIMLAIPFGLVGAFWGHLVLGLNLTIMSLLGMVALAGVVVNDSLVMVHFINQKREAGMFLSEAVREAGAVRFRPILLTSLTTFAGLSPLLLEKSMQARFLIPMAASLAFGVMFATFVTLVLVPTSYVILEDLKAFAGALWRLFRPPSPWGAL